MIKYNTRSGMLDTITVMRAKLDQRLAILTEEEFCRPGLMDEWSAKDILMHLVDWEQRVIHWYEAGLRGETPAVPGEGYTWATIPAMNRLCFESHRDMPAEEVRQRYQGSYEQTIELLRQISEEDLFTPGRYRWATNWPLAEFFASCTHKHYDWAIKNIKLSKLRPKS